MSQREPGSVIEERIYLEEKAREGMILGQIERKCAGCGRDWDGDVPKGETVSLGRRAGVCSHCGSPEFSVREIRPTGMTITGMGIGQAVEPPRPKVAASSADLFTLANLRTALFDVESYLLAADAAARRLVNSGNSTTFETFSRLQEGLNLMCTPGGFEIDLRQPMKAVGLLMMLRPLVGEIDRTLARYEEESRK